MRVYLFRYIHHTVYIPRSGPLCPGDNNAFFIIFRLFANLQGRVGREQVDCTQSNCATGAFR